MKQPFLTKRVVGARVVAGAGRGNRIGVPTINLDPNLGDFREGIYVCRAILPDGAYWGVLHFGPRPTFGEKPVTCEIHLFDFAKPEPTPKKLDIEIFDYIRPVVKFKNVSAMLSAIAKDVEFAKKKIGKYARLASF